MDCKKAGNLILDPNIVDRGNMNKIVCPSCGNITTSTGEAELSCCGTGRIIVKVRSSQMPIYYILYTEEEGSLSAKGEPLWQVHPQIAPLERDQKMIKYYADSFLKTEKHKLLEQDGVDTIVVCGVQTEFCIDTTVKTHGITLS